MCIRDSSDVIRTHTRARVVLGPATAEEVRSVLGAPPHTTPVAEMPPGRGYARLGGGPVVRLQVPATPDPLDEEADEADRGAVMALLPERSVPMAAAMSFTKSAPAAQETAPRVARATGVEDGGSVPVNGSPAAPVEG